jgi:hypothetical protein
MTSSQLGSLAVLIFLLDTNTYEISKQVSVLPFNNDFGKKQWVQRRRKLWTALNFDLRLEAAWKRFGDFMG